MLAHDLQHHPSLLPAALQPELTQDVASPFRQQIADARKYADDVAENALRIEC